MFFLYGIHRTKVFIGVTIANLTGSEEIQSAHLTGALHASQPPEIDDVYLIPTHHLLVQPHRLRHGFGIQFILQ
jgi:hypothetical protein